jgi:MFS family permease
MSLTAAAFPKSQQGRALGIYNGILGVGLALAPLVGGYIVSFLGWRWVFFVNIPVVVVSLSICLWAIRGKDEKKPHRVDGFGIALLAFTLSCIVFSVSQGPDHGWTSPTILITFGLGVLSALVFVIVETRMSEPLIPFALLRNRSFLTAAILSVVAVGFAWAVVFLAPLYLHQVFGYSSYQVGLLLLPMTVMTAIIPPLAGRLLDSRGALACVLLILVLTVGSYSLQLMSHQLFVVLLAFALFGAAWGAGNGIGVPLALMEVDDLADSGVMSGAVITLLNVSGVLVLSLSATVLHSFQTSALRQHLSPPSALAHGYQVTVAVLLLLTLVLMAIAIGSARSRSTPRERKTG